VVEAEVFELVIELAAKPASIASSAQKLARNHGFA
jgi:hypothetical protein